MDKNEQDTIRKGVINRQDLRDTVEFANTVDRVPQYAGKFLNRYPNVKDRLSLNTDKAGHVYSGTGQKAKLLDNQKLSHKVHAYLKSPATQSQAGIGKQFMDAAVHGMPAKPKNYIRKPKINEMPVQGELERMRDDLGQNMDCDVAQAVKRQTQTISPKAMKLVGLIQGKEVVNAKVHDRLNGVKLDPNAVYDRNQIMHQKFGPNHPPHYEQVTNANMFARINSTLNDNKFYHHNIKERAGQLDNGKAHQQYYEAEKFHEITQTQTQNDRYLTGLIDGKTIDPMHKIKTNHMFLAQSRPLVDIQSYINARPKLKKGLGVTFAHPSKQHPEQYEILDKYKMPMSHQGLMKHAAHYTKTARQGLQNAISRQGMGYKTSMMQSYLHEQAHNDRKLGSELRHEMDAKAEKHPFITHEDPRPGHTYTEPNFGGDFMPKSMPSKQLKNYSKVYQNYPGLYKSLTTKAQKPQKSQKPHRRNTQTRAQIRQVVKGYDAGLKNVQRDKVREAKQARQTKMREARTRASIAKNNRELANQVRNQPHRGIHRDGPTGR